MADEIDISNDRAAMELARALQARQRIKDTPSLHCTGCGADNKARAEIGRSRCIDCQCEYERGYAGYKVR